MELTLYKENKNIHNSVFRFLMTYDTVHISLFVWYLAGGTFLHSPNNSLSGQVNQDVGAIIIQGHIVSIKGDNTQVRHHSAST